MALQLDEAADKVTWGCSAPSCRSQLVTFHTVNHVAPSVCKCWRTYVLNCVKRCLHMQVA